MPARMNLSRVLIRRIVAAETPTDKYRQQPVGLPEYNPPKESPAEVFFAQIAEDSRQRRVRTELGRTPRGEGRLVYPTPINAALHLKPGDLIVGLPRVGNPVNNPADWTTHDFVVTDVKAESYLGGAPTLWYADYDRSDRVTASR